MTKVLRSILAACLVGVVACDPGAPPAGPEAAPADRDGAGAEEMARGLRALPSAVVLDVAEDGSPTFVRGKLGQLGDAAMTGMVSAQARARDAVDGVAPLFRTRADELEFVGAREDAQGHTHLRYAQRVNGRPVVGGELRLHADAEGRIYLANGRLYARVPDAPADVAPEAAAQAARTAKAEVLGAEARTTQLAYVPDAAGRLALAWEAEVTGEAADGTPVRDLVYVDARSGAELLRAPQIHVALNRAVYSANNGTSLPGTLRRSEGGAATGDAHVDDNYTHLGTTYQCYQQVFGRDSYNGAGAQLRSTVHYSTNYVNAFWNGSQMVYGDGNGTQSGPLGRDLDVTVHELTHAVTDSESDLVYQGESGALNEGMSDIFAAFCESWTRSWSTDADVWKIGEDIWTPATAGDALRYMANPTQDGSSRDYYPERYTGTQDSGGVHWNSGIANLAFKLLSTGGTHPRAKTTINVPAIGVERAGRIFYHANTNIMTSSTNFAAAKTATEQASDALGYDAATKAAVTAAWQAVGVGGGTTPPPTGDTPLTNGVAVTNLSGASGATLYFKLEVPTEQTSLTFQLSGGTGDADMYVRQGSRPTTSTYQCRPYLNGNNETCTFTSGLAGTWYVMVRGYSSFSGVSLKGTYASSPPPTGPQLNVTNISGASGSTQYWTLNVPAGVSTLTFKTAGGTGDADMYVRFGSAPTTSTYQCRPYLNGNNETCTFNAPSAGTWHVMLRGYTAYSGVTLTGQY